MIIQEIKGNLLDTDLKYIAHGVNCQNRMGSGVAKAILTHYPNVKSEYHKFYEEVIMSPHIKSRNDLLGIVQPVEVRGGKTVFNLFTQENYGYDDKVYVDYSAIRKCFDILLEKCDYVDKIAIPRIGCGLAGGDWDIVKQIINESVGDRVEVFVYYL